MKDLKVEAIFDNSTKINCINKSFANRINLTIQWEVFILLIEVTEAYTCFEDIIENVKILIERVIIGSHLYRVQMQSSSTPRLLMLASGLKRRGKTGCRKDFDISSLAYGWPYSMLNLYRQKYQNPILHKSFSLWCSSSCFHSSQSAQRIRHISPHRALRTLLPSRDLIGPLKHS